VLSSVHAFATDPRRGLFILAFLVIVIGSSLLLFAWRAPKVGLGQRFGMFSRESMLLANNMMLAAACGAVLLGTLYPLFLDALGLGKISVGPPYFDAVFGLLMVPLVVVMGIGPLTRWKTDEFLPLARRLRLAAVLTVLAALAAGWAAGKVSLLTTGGLMMAFWIIATLGVDLKQRLLPAGGSLAQIGQRARQLPTSMIGMMLAHLGIAVFTLGVTMVNSFQTERDVKMSAGDTVEMGGYVFRMLGVREVQGPNYVAARARIEVTRHGQPVTFLSPEKRVYRVQTNPMTEDAIHSTVTRDLYVAMGEQLPGGEWIVRFWFKPFIGWIWGGCLIMMVGGLLATTDRRYRARRGATVAASGTAGSTA
jgi:cytochrome c-type biogenesis protein CcmF